MNARHQTRSTVWSERVRPVGRMEVDAEVCVVGRKEEAKSEGCLDSVYQED